ncbi:hypothetical protein H5407_13440 [Mitsuaria sp. WAJ17]|uniref:hypothetical protein n=1 Tax=Mitsuaria sp. WAJ17 TaxID=2761452 RepID=UPI0016002C63|nr:hypothetical protein [Mitsuaria sp. WAJ17]MBB2486221.1 hypothetical protein [Mitsuaria sp. WAJ17]
MKIEQSAEPSQGMRLFVLVVYLIYGLGLLTGVAALLALMLTCLRLKESQGTIYHSHLRWMLRGFWLCFVGFALGGVLVWTNWAGPAIAEVTGYPAHDLQALSSGVQGVGRVVLGLTWFCGSYLVVRGLLNWSEHRRMP